MNSQRKLIRAAMIADGAGVRAAPGAIVVEGERIEASGAPQSIGAAGCEIIDLPDSVVVPALVNAHAHLDLTHLGPRSLSGGFSEWADGIRQDRARTADAIRESVCHGIRLSRRGGTAVIGDIAGAGSLEPLKAMRQAGVGGVSYIEVFGLGRRQGQATSYMRALVEHNPALREGVAMGLQPHAPYSCGLEVYRTAAALAVARRLRLATHLAESLEELEFVDRRTGPLAEMVQRILGPDWDDSIEPAGRHPIDHLLPALGTAPVAAAHLNYIDDRHLPLLAAANVSVVYCPRASAYFGHPHGGHPPHRYRQMLEAGINVALGTDSMVCLDTPDRLSVLDEMRLLYQRDGVDPTLLLRMGTVNGASALGIEPALVTLAPGPSAGLLAIRGDKNDRLDPLRSIMMNDHAPPPEWVLGPIKAQDSWHVQRQHR